MSNPEELATHPDYCLNEVDLDRLEYGFLKLDSGAYRRSAFMDQRIHSEKRESVRVPLGVMDKLVADIQASGRPIPNNAQSFSSMPAGSLRNASQSNVLTRAPGKPPINSR